ncbi:hypothetical protein [Vibrio rotiferianus]|uniref:hypothetical protein n=1 Tax=Vibrio rotiferianus TaxID=190895 RepID=UPI001F115EA8|nr:hypothetical protein [Vibrio rotiferianus]
MKKLKQQYRSHIKANGRIIWDVFPFVRSGTHKHFSTKQEKSYFFLHEVEYREYPIKLRAARGKCWPILGMIILHTYMTLLSAGSIIRKGVTSTTNNYY